MEAKETIMTLSRNRQGWIAVSLSVLREGFAFGVSFAAIAVAAFVTHRPRRLMDDEAMSATLPHSQGAIP